MKNQLIPAVVLSLVFVVWPASLHAGDAFTVNTTTAGEQSFPDVAAAPGGTFAVVWQAENQDGDGWGVFARWFDWKGEAITGEVHVNTGATGHQISPKIDGDGQGRFVVVWRDENTGIRARRFDGFGLPLGVEIDVVGPAPVPFAPSLSVNDAGDFIVLWLVYDLPEIRVAARRFNANGSPAGEAVEVHAFARQPYTYNEGSAVSMLNDRSSIAVWSDGKEVFARRYDTVGDPLGGQFQVSQLNYPYSFTSAGVDVASDETGGFRIVWWNDINLEESTTMTRTVNSVGVLGDLTDLLLTTRDWPGPGFSMTGDGTFVITRLGAWPYHLEARRLDKNLVQLGSYDVADDLDDDWCVPGVDHGGDDSREFVVVWQERPTGASDPDIRARIFGHAIFIDNFESGSTSSWSEATTG